MDGQTNIKSLLNENVTGVIPAAGKGSRLGPLPICKELFPIGFQKTLSNGKLLLRPKPISEYILDQFVEAGIKRVFIVLGEGKETIMEYFGNGNSFGINIAYLFQDELNGMPFAIDLVRPWLPNNQIIVLGMPDTIIAPSKIFSQLLESHINNSADLTLGAFQTNKPYKYCMIDFDNELNVKTVIDKPKNTRLNYAWGIACWSGKFGDFMHDYLTPLLGSINEIVLGEVIQSAIDNGLRVSTRLFDDGDYLDIGTLDDLVESVSRYSK